MTRTTVAKVGRNHGQPRIWLEGRYLRTLGFEPGTRVGVTLGKGLIRVRTSPTGKRRVSRKGEKSVIDLNAAGIEQAIGACSRVEIACKYGRITITPARVEARIAALPADRTVGSIFSGGGLMDQAARELPAITKRYFNGQGGQPVVAHPERPEAVRWLTVGEVKRLMGLPDHYWLPPQKTLAGKVLGQGVLVDVFRRIVGALDQAAGTKAA